MFKINENVEIKLTKQKGLSSLRTSQYLFKLKRQLILNAPCIQYFEPVWTVADTPNKIYNLGPYREFLY
jgi:hypothetical protein